MSRPPEGVRISEDKKVATLVTAAKSLLEKPLRETTQTELEEAARSVSPTEAMAIAVRDALESLQRAVAKPPEIGHHHDRGYRLIDPSTVTPRAIEWAWKDRIPTSTLTLIAGPGGVGKGAMWVDIVSQATRGTLDGDLAGPVSVLVLTSEEAIDDVIAPRLEAAGADSTRVRVMTISGEYDRDATLPDDLPALRAAQREIGARLIVIDPLNGHLSERIDSHKDAPLRRALSPLTRFAQETRTAVIGVAHTNKGSGDAINRILGSVGYVNAARSVLIVGRPPSDDETTADRIVAMPKSNNRPAVPSLRFTLEGRRVDAQLPDGTLGATQVVGVTWRGEDTATADDIMGTNDDRLAHGEALDFLADFLSEGPALKAEVIRAAKRESIAERTLQRARKTLGVVVERDVHQRGRPSTWKLPSDYVPGGFVSQPMAHNPQASDLGKHHKNGDYVPDIDDGTKPPKQAHIEAAEQLLRAAELIPPNTTMRDSHFSDTWGSKSDQCPVQHTTPKRRLDPQGGMGAGRA